MLSLIEQRDMFEGGSGEFPSDESCKSFARSLHAKEDSGAEPSAAPIAPRSKDQGK